MKFHARIEIWPGFKRHDIRNTNEGVLPARFTFAVTQVTSSSAAPSGRCSVAKMATVQAVTTDAGRKELLDQRQLRPPTKRKPPAPTSRANFNKGRLTALRGQRLSLRGSGR